MAGGYGRSEPLFLILIIFLAMGWVACLLRAWVKIIIIRKISLDDYLMLGAILFYTGYAAAGLIGVVKGLGMLKYGLTPSEASTGLRSWWLCEILYAPLTLLSRTSVAMFLLRIAVQKVHKRIIIWAVAAFWAVTLPLLLIMIFQCHPVSYFWMQPFPSAPRGTCLDPRIIFLVSVLHSAISACCDWTLGFMPIFMLWKVQLNKRTKFTLSLLLGMGFFAGIALIVRITYVHPFGVSTDFLYQSINVADWSILEPGICIIAGCIATYRPLFSRCGFAERAKSSYRSPVTAGRHSPSTHGVHRALGSRDKNGNSVCGSVSHHTNRFEQQNSTFIIEHKDTELKDYLGRGEELSVDETQSKKTKDRDQCAIAENSNANRGDNHDGNATTPIPAQPPLLCASNGLNISPLFAFTSPYTSPSQLQVLLPEQRQNNTEQLSAASPPPPIMPPSSLTVPPPPCRIFVQTATRVEYVNTPSVKTMPAIPIGSHSTTASSLVTDELPKSMTFHGGHSIHISGSVSDTTQTSET